MWSLIIFIGWIIGIILLVLAIITRFDAFDYFSDLIFCAIAGLAAGDAMNELFLNKVAPEQSKKETCVTYNGTKFCGPSKFETSKEIVEIAPDGSISVVIK